MFVHFFANLKAKFCTGKIICKNCEWPASFEIVSAFIFLQLQTLYLVRNCKISNSGVGCPNLEHAIKIIFYLKIKLWKCLIKAFIELKVYNASLFIFVNCTGPLAGNFR